MLGPRPGLSVRWDKGTVKFGGSPVLGHALRIAPVVVCAKDGGFRARRRLLFAQDGCCLFNLWLIKIAAKG